MTNKQTIIKRVLIGIGIAAIVISIVSFTILNWNTMGEETFSFTSTYQGDEVTLKATIWEEEDAEYAVLICPGYSCDRQKWRPLANLFTSNGMTVMSFDYSGQGGSNGTIGFDNAKTDDIAVEIADAIEVLHERTGIDYDHIILVGHSMGGRSILRLLQDYNNPEAETTVTKRNIENVILIAPEVNYYANAQASLFAGTTDAEEEPWASYDSSFIKGTNVYLYGSTADDIVSDKDILAIYERLGATDVPESGVYTDSQVNSYGSKITVGVTSGVLHSYQMYSAKFAEFVNEAVEDITGTESSFNAGLMRLVYVGWFSALIGIFTLLYGLNMGSKITTEGESLPVLENSKSFLIRKLIMWIPGILMAFVICCICVAMPFGSPIMNIPYMCFIAGYGLVMLIAYRKGTFKGTSGKLPKPTLKTRSDWKHNLWCFGIVALLCIFAWYVLRASMYRLMPLNWRLFWLIFNGALMTIGYYVSGTEQDMLENAGAGRGTRFLYSLIQYVPLFLFVLFYLVIKSYSGLIGQIVNVLLMYILCIPIGTFVRHRTGNRLIAAILTAVLFQLLMINSAALISMF
ncbi:MAG: alpha/beta hydrolase [Oscillospiraceae bacterium]|nr:alpha/beta hydrolase [Oscillospiraceae bacterium]